MIEYYYMFVYFPATTAMPHTTPSEYSISLLHHAMHRICEIDKHER